MQAIAARNDVRSSLCDSQSLNRTVAWWMQRIGSRQLKSLSVRRPEENDNSCSVVGDAQMSGVHSLKSSQSRQSRGNAASEGVPGEGHRPVPQAL